MIIKKNVVLLCLLPPYGGKKSREKKQRIATIVYSTLERPCTPEQNESNRIEQANFTMHIIIVYGLPL